MLDGVEIDGAAVGALEQHVVQPDVGRAVGVAIDLIGALVHHLEAHVLQHGHALGERDRPAVAPDLQSDGIALVPGAAVEVDAERPGDRQSFDDADVGHRGHRRIDLPITLRECVVILREHGARLDRIVGARELVLELVDPGPHDRLDRAFQGAAIGVRHLATGKRR